MAITAIFLPALSFAQIGLNSNTPTATLDLISSPNEVADGLSIPRLTGDELKAKDNAYQIAQDAAVVFVTTVPTNASSKTSRITSPGYYYYNASAAKWMSLNYPKFFYMPPIALDTTMMGEKEIDLYQLYYQQHTQPMKSSTNSVGKVPVLNPLDLEYYVTFYDTAVFSNLSITKEGKLKYTVVNNATDTTFMNIVFVVK